MQRTYHQLTDRLEQGPRNKKDATIDFEEIIIGILTPGNQTHIDFNQDNELIIRIQKRTYNLTHILKAEPDFDHITLNEKIIKYYELYIREDAINKPQIQLGENKKIQFGKDILQPPTRDEYAILDPENNHKHLMYGEKLAITLYTNQRLSQWMNTILRSEGKLNIATLKKDWRSTVKEAILAIGIASQALAKTPARHENDHLTSDEIELYRHEITNNKINDQRIHVLTHNQIIRDTAFTSTDTVNHSNDENYLTHDPSKKKKGFTRITYRQLLAYNSLGKNVRNLSEYIDDVKEDEVLFPPGTNYKFYSCETEKRFSFFSAIPVRPVNGTTLSYVSGTGEIYREMLKLSKSVTESSKNKLSIEDLDNMMTRMKSLIENKATILQYPANELFQQINNLKLIKHAEYAYDTHYRHPLKNHSCDAIYKYGNKQVIHRPNHGLAHSIRAMVLIPAVIDFFVHHATEMNFRNYCKELTIENIYLIQFAMLFTVSGRECETRFSENPELFAQYKQQSANNFTRYAESIGMNASEMEKYAELIQFMCNPNYLEKKISDDCRYIYHIMSLVHNLELMRCYDNLGHYEDAVGSIVKSACKTKDAGNNPYAINDFFKLLNLASCLLQITGDREFIRFQDNDLVEVNYGYNEKIFPRASTDAVFCFNRCYEMLLKIAPPPLRESARLQNNISRMKLTK